MLIGNQKKLNEKKITVKKSIEFLKRQKKFKNTYPF